jgi:hypothetical protein
MEIVELAACGDLPAEQIEHLIRRTPVDGKTYTFAEVGNG